MKFWPVYLIFYFCQLYGGLIHESKLQPTFLFRMIFLQINGFFLFPPKNSKFLIRYYELVPSFLVHHKKDMDGVAGIIPDDIPGSAPQH